MFKFNNKDTRTLPICVVLIPFFINFERISSINLVFLVDFELVFECQEEFLQEGITRRYFVKKLF